MKTTANSQRAQAGRTGAFILALLLLVGVALGANTGNIQGKVTDRRTGEALVGVNIIVEGTELGAATDINGQFLIINIPPGKYTITASYMGYNPSQVTGVQVVQDLTVTQDFKLSPTVIDIGRTVEVTARKKDMVQRQAVSVERIITDDEFKRLPVTDIRDIVGLQAGVTQVGRTTFIRGGRSDDVAYLVDGVSSGDALVGDLFRSPKPTTDALASVVVITGGFDAEYGQAMSGIIKAVTKEGGTRTTGRFSYTTDDIFAASTGYNYGFNRLTLSLGGPTPIWNRLRYFLSGEYNKTDDDREIRYKVTAPRSEYAAEGKLTLQAPKAFALTREGLKFTVDAYHSNYEWQEYGHTRTFSVASLPSNRVRSTKGNLTINHLLSSSTVYEAKFGLFTSGVMYSVRNYEAEAADTVGFWGMMRKLGIWDRYFFRSEDWVTNWEKYRDYELANGVTDTMKSRRDAVLRLYRSFWLDGSGNPVYAHGSIGNWTQEFMNVDNPFGVSGLFVTEGDYRLWQYYQNDNVIGKFDLTHTVSKIHEIKTGVSVTGYTLEMLNNSLPWDQNPFWDAYRYQPIVAAAYVQDRADFEDLVVRAGVRFDYLDSKAKVRVYPESLGARDEIADLKRDAGAKYRLSPRLGLSYPITERIKFRFSYGHFFKNPTLDNLYTYADRTAAELRSRGNVIVGNADMGAEKTIAYELGFDAQLSDIFSFDVTAFYKDVFDLSGVRVVPALPQPYTMFYNVEYARIQGFEATMSKQLDQYWSSRVGYTFQVAKGTASNAYTQYQRETPLQLDYYLDQDQRHGFHADLTFSFPTDFGFVPMRDFEVSGLFAFGSGLPYTPTDQRGTATGITNSARMPGTWSLDGRIAKDFRLGGVGLTVNCDVSNVLNTENWVAVHSTTGLPYNTGRVITEYDVWYGGMFGDYGYHPARDYNHDGYISRSEAYDSYVRAYNYKNDYPTYYGAPRKIRLGVSLSF
jgi:outer membrane receptor protein involved in Fe transport